MNESNSPLTFLLVLNSFLTIFLIVNQNDSGKSAANEPESSVSNPLETATWICLFIQFVLLLGNLKMTDF